MIKNYNEALDKVRKRVMNKFPKKSVEYYLLKKFNWTLFKDEVRENESKWNKKLHRLSTTHKFWTLFLEYLMN